MKLKRFNELKASLQFCSFYFHGGYNRPTNILEFFCPDLPEAFFGVNYRKPICILHKGLEDWGGCAEECQPLLVFFFAEYRLVTTVCWRFSYIHKKNFVYISTFPEKGFQTLLFVPTPKN